MKKITKTELIVALVIFAACIIFATVEPLTKLAAQLVAHIFSNLELYLETGFKNSIVVFFIVGILYIVWRFVRYRWTNRYVIKARKEARKKHPDFFEEMQSALRSILLPLGFKEQKLKERAIDYREPETWADFKRDEYIVSLWLYHLAPSYSIGAWHWKKSEKGRRKKVEDFSLERWEISEADEFKSVAIEKLNEWLVEQGIK